MTSNLRRWFVLFAAVCVVTVVASCGGSSVRLPGLEKNATVLAFGDSLTFGTGATPDQSYPARLSSLIGRQIVNHGVPGEISRDGLNRLPGLLDDVKPALLILCHGGNDFLRKLDSKESEANLRAMIKIARDRNISVLLMATPKPGLLLSVPDFYEKIGSELAVPVESAVLVKVLGDNSMKSDLVHPNAMGYSKIAEALAAALKRAGAV
jgi:lysophospholipase L1-like esterase